MQRVKKYAYRINALLHNGLDFELYGRLTNAEARRIADKLNGFYARSIIKAFSMQQGSNVHPPQSMIIELNEEGLDAEIDRQIFMLKNLPTL